MLQESVHVWRTQLTTTKEKDGAKAVKVGTRIAVTAEPGDDLSSLELPADDSAPAKPSAPQKEQPAPQAEPKKSTPTKASPSASQSPPSQRPASSSPDRAHTQTTSSGKPMSTKYPLYPSVEHLLHTHSIPESVFSQIPATGPAGRLLKGDVLAHLGKVAASYPSDQAARLDKLGHLDLSNVKKAAPPAKKPAAAAAKPAATPEVPTQVAVHVSLAAVLATQQRLRDALGLDLPLAIFIARASALANEDLPLAGPPSADALFDALVGRPGAAPRSSHGSYTPQITALPPAVAVPRAAAPPPPRRRVDIIDVLTGKTAPKRALGPAAPAVRGVSGVGAAGSNVFSVGARRGEERRVRTYLERVKTVLEKEPARLVL